LVTKKIIKRAFGDFRNDTDTIRVRALGRHPLDVMRTIAHELIHYKHKNKHSSEQSKEDEANAIAGRIMRKYDQQNPHLFNEDATAASGASPYLGAAQAVVGKLIAAFGMVNDDEAGVLAALQIIPCKRW